MKFRKLISFVTAVGMAFMVSVVPVHGAESNPKQNFHNTEASAYYSLERFETTRATLKTSVEDGIGTVYTASASGLTQATGISHYWAYTPTANAAYFAFMYCYNGADTQSDMIYTLAENSTAITRSVTLKGDGKWRMGVWDFSDADMAGKHIKWYQHFYAKTPGCYNGTYSFANYNIFKNNPEIKTIDKAFSPAAGEYPDTDTSTDGNYDINYIRWYNEDGSELEEAFESNKKYTVEMSMTAHENYFFAENGWDLENSNFTTAKLDNYLYENTLVLTAEFDTQNLLVESISIENDSHNVSPILEKIDISFNKRLDRSTFNDTNVIIEPVVSWYPDFTDDSNVSIVFDESLVPGEDYTITFTDAIISQNKIAMVPDTVYFGVADSYPNPEYVSSTVTDGEKNVSDKVGRIDVIFDMQLKPDTIKKEYITVSPEVSYNVSPLERGFRLIFDELSRNTCYTIRYSEDIKSVYDTPVEGNSISFTTIPVFKNMIENGDMEFTENTEMFDDAQSNTLIRYAKEEDGNSVLKWTSKWDTAPVGSYVDWIPGHKYYISVRVKPDRDAVIYFDPHYRHDSGSYHQAGNKNVPANTWSTITAEYTIPTDKLESGTIFDDADTIRVVIKTGGAVVLIDDWMMYDMSLAPEGRATVISTEPAMGQTEISPFDVKATLEFDIPVNPDTISNISSSPTAIKSVELADDLTTCTITFNELKVNTTYMITVPETVLTMRGEKAKHYKYAFSTYTVPDKTLGVAFASIAQGEQKVSLYNEILDITFDSYADEKTLTADNIKLVPDIIKEIKTAPKGVSIVFDNDKITHDTEYTLTLSDSIKNLNGNALSPYELKFKTKSKADIVNSFNAASTKELMQSFMENDYSDLMAKSDLYHNLSEIESPVIDTLYSALPGSSAADSSSLQKIIDEKLMYITAAEGNEAEIQLLIESNTLGLNSKDIYKVYTYLDDKSTLFDDISELTLSADADIQATVAEQIIMAAIRNANGWEKVCFVLKNSKEFFTEDMDSLLTDVDNLTSPSKAYTVLQNYDAKNLSDIYDKLDDKYDDLKGSGSGNSGSKVDRGGNASSFAGVITDAELIPQEIFTDIDSVQWAKSSIESFYNKGIITGKGYRLFAPYDKVTREEFVKMFVLSTGTYDENAIAVFSDIPSGHWCVSYVGSAAKSGLISGMSDTVFGLSENITREDIAVIIYRYLKGKNILISDKSEFDDINTVSAYAKDAVVYLRGAGIANGDDMNNYNPKSLSTRAEAVVLLDRMIQLCTQ